MKHECNNCGNIYDDDSIPVPLEDTPDLGQRIAPGEIVPSGECECGALCHPVEEKPKRSAREQQIWDLAQTHAREGELEFEPDGSKVSEGDDNGAYVQAWYWVPFSGTPLDKEAS